MAESTAMTGAALRKEMAVRELSRGKGVAQAARVVGVNRATLYRWLQEPEFVASLNRWQAGAMVLARGRLFAGAEDAARTLARAARRGDVRAAGILLRGLGFLMPGEVGSQDPQMIARQQELADRSDQLRLDQADQALREVEALTAIENRIQENSPLRQTGIVDPGLTESAEAKSAAGGQKEQGPVGAGTAAPHATSEQDPSELEKRELELQKNAKPRRVSVYEEQRAAEANWPGAKSTLDQEAKK